MENLAKLSLGAKLVRRFLPVTAALILSASSVLSAEKAPEESDYVPPEFVEARSKADAPANVKTFVSRANEARREYCKAQSVRIDKAREDLRKGRKGSINTKLGEAQYFEKTKRWAFPNSRVQKKWITDKEAELSQAKENAAKAASTFFMVGGFPSNPKKGDIGHVDYGARVIQVVSASELLVDLKMCDDCESQTVWLSGFSTEGVTDGKRLAIKSTLTVSGTKSYTSALGTKKTVLAVESFDVEKYLEPISTHTGRD